MSAIRSFLINNYGKVLVLGVCLIAIRSLHMTDSSTFAQVVGIAGWVCEILGIFYFFQSTKPSEQNS